ncbi:MAG: M48 family metallopeptidase [Alphaproteobacteria bacterium]|nr:M48 family metallopeptidase [Alphaproteobacteria bacterium]
MSKLGGKLFRPLEAAFVEGQMWRDEDGQYWLETVVTLAEIVQVKLISPAVGRVPNLITLQNGLRFETCDSLPRGFTGNLMDGVLRWLGVFHPVKALILALVLVAAVVGIRKVLPGISDAVLVLVPHQVDVILGQKVEKSVDGVFFSPSMLSETEQRHAEEIFTPLAERAFAGTAFAGRLLVRNSELFGANALAMPGGVVVVTDDLLHLLKEYPDELAAVLAHEVMHVRARHGVRQVLRYMGMSFMAFLFGLDDSVVEEFALSYSALARAGYSRNFEREADLGAVELLLEQGIDPTALSRALARLELAACGEAGCLEGSWLTSHPDFPERRRLIQQRSP